MSSFTSETDSMLTPKVAFGAPPDAVIVMLSTLILYGHPLFNAAELERRRKSRCAPLLRCSPSTTGIYPRFLRRTVMKGDLETMVKQTSASSPANARNRASSNTAKSAGKKGGNYFI